MNACHTLRDYSEYVARIRTYSDELPLADAVEKAIIECIHENILRDFLLKNKAEAKAMSIYEYDEEKTMRMFRDEWYDEGNQDGIKTGKILATIEMCLEFSLSSDAILQKLMTKFQLSKSQAQEYLDKYGASEASQFPNKNS